MYNHASSTYMTVMHHSLPSPEYTGDSDSDSDIMHELERKRRLLDEEIARFRAQKEKEFRDFEAELKARRRQNRAQQHPQKHNAKHYEFTKHSPSATPPTVSTLSGCKKTRSANSPHGYRQSEPMKLIKSTIGSKVTPPTICLDKTNIKGESIPQSHANSSQTPPTPPIASSTPSIGQDQPSPRTDEKQASPDSASIQSEPPRDKPPISPEEKSREKAFAGLFVPAYLPLLDARHDRHGLDRTIEGIQTEPASPLERTMAMESVGLQSASLPTESSMTEPLQIPTTKRAYTSPSSVNRGTLPPIIRNVNGRKRTSSKRKHVTFQLADRAIVEPSSSYEQGPSPDADDDLSDRRTSNDSTDSTLSQENSDLSQRPAIQRRHTPRDPLGRRKREYTPMSTPDSEVGMSMGDLLLGNIDEATATQAQPRSAVEQDGYFSPRHGHHSPASPSPERRTSFNSVDEDAYINKRKTVLTSQKTERRSSKSPNGPRSQPRKTPFDPAGSISSDSADAHQSSRFSPHHSLLTPSSQLQHRYPGRLEDDLLSSNSNVGFFELDEELSSPTAGIPTPDQPEHKEDELEPHPTKGKKKQGAGAFPDELQTGTSVPIDIVRPGSVSNSWVGTFGH